MKTSVFKRTLTIVLVLAMLAALLPATALAVDENVGTGKTNKSDINFRTGPGTQYELLSKIAKGKEVVLLDTISTEGWFKISVDGVEGYVSSEFITIIEYTGPQPEPGYTTRSAKLRSTAATNGSVLATIAKYTAITVLDKTNAKWWKVSYDSKTGFMAVGDVKLGEPPAQSTSTLDGKATTKDVNAELIAAAKKKNSDTIGWISVPNTNISDPILYAANFYYANRDINKNKSVEGVYPSVNKITSNIALFGHNLRGSNRGFHQMHHLQEVAMGYSTCQYASCGKSISNLSGWNKTAAGRTWNISIFGKQKWEVWAMYEVPKNEPISTLRNNWNVSPAKMSTWIKGQLDRSQINFGVSVSEKDKILTIITCGTYYDSATANSRLFVFLKCVD